MSDDAASDRPSKKIVPPEEHSSSFLAQEIRAFLSGIMFFTRLPVPEWVDHNMYWLSLSTAYFPLIGVFVALFGAFWYILSLSLWDANIAAYFYTLSTVWLTGAFHEDGLADTFDGFGGGWGRTQILTIMRDSRLGTYGAIGLLLVVSLKLSALARFAALAPFSISGMTGIFVTAHVMGRWSCTYLLWAYPYVENVSAKGKEFSLKVTIPRLVFTTLTTIVFVGISLAWDVEKMAIIWAVSIVTTLVMGAYIDSVIGGVIGDCLGATNQVVELASYLALSADWAKLLQYMY
ncbi:vitamin B12 biosynthesis CobS, cobalamin-5-phosphate synthase [Polychytrium aggregatum]|uniref:vitamin B12 biosynthesis CobS, cobalamin-5-phosphate synthase n=1 Tax=Polychytrium aggregatum TaxID=110093 RepID=UPI0022FE7028|nr:vitamin B12 biosynthesis CobS, cobalamin-5-phosphate synthase [Polychytrium aggregatum]KAI9208313.1 vitamin B12 biosynthesis CobS, cobalamin-5-phosphate synthase [Polychytrium aggregatum]